MLGPDSSDPHRLANLQLPIPTRASTSAFGRQRHWPWSRARAGGAVRQSETFIMISDPQLLPGHDPGADCGEAPNGRQRGSWPLVVLVEWCSYKPTTGSGQKKARDEMIMAITWRWASAHQTRTSVVGGPPVVGPCPPCECDQRDESRRLLPAQRSRHSRPTVTTVTGDTAPLATVWAARMGQDITYHFSKPAPRG